MIDIKVIRENPRLVKENIKKKFQNEKIKLVDEIGKLDDQWRKLKYDADQLRSERNSVSQEINKAKKEGKSASQLLKKAKAIPKKLEKLEAKTAKLESDIKELMLKVPNIMSNEVPTGKDDSDNPEIKKWGKIPKFDFPIKNHVELLEALKLADFEASAISAGKGFYYLKGELAILNQALIRFGIDLVEKKGYEYIETPLMLNERSIYASMDKQEIGQSVYNIKGEDLHLIGTAEQSLLAFHSGQTLHEYELPKKYFSYSMCFRKEIGAHGINEKGLWRTHQFNKVEQFVFCKPEDSEKIYDEMLSISEEVLQKLELPYRVIEICSGTLSDWKYRSADLEVWRPTTKMYGEVMSLSNCTDYQARKLGIRMVDKHGNRTTPHTLNNTAIATSRIMVALVENNQQKDGGIKIPKALWPYTGFKEIKPKEKKKQKKK